MYTPKSLTMHKYSYALRSTSVLEYRNNVFGSDSEIEKLYENIIDDYYIGGDGNIELSFKGKHIKYNNRLRIFGESVNSIELPEVIEHVKALINHGHKGGSKSFSMTMYYDDIFNHRTFKDDVLKLIEENGLKDWCEIKIVVLLGNSYFKVYSFQYGSCTEVKLCKTDYVKQRDRDYTALKLYLTKEETKKYW